MKPPWAAERIPTLLEPGRMYAAYAQHIAFRFIAESKSFKRRIKPKNGLVYGYWPFIKYEFFTEGGYGLCSEQDGLLFRLTPVRTDEEIYKLKHEDFPKEYPKIYELGVEVDIDDLGPPYVDRKLLYTQLEKLGGAKFTKQYSENFGVQTMSMKGAYPWDVEATLRRLSTGRKQTAAEWD